MSYCKPVVAPACSINLCWGPTRVILFAFSADDDDDDDEGLEDLSDMSGGDDDEEDDASEGEGDSGQ